MIQARSIRVRGVVQGVGFRPLVYRLATAKTLAGWVRNGDDGVEIHLEGPEFELNTFLGDLERHPPGSAHITGIEVHAADPKGFRDFAILDSHKSHDPTVAISPDLPVCEACLTELFDPANRRYRYPYINCCQCGPRYSIVLSLPYDRSNTTMQSWTLDNDCSREYHNPADRRFHAQPVSCAACGPQYFLQRGPQVSEYGNQAIAKAAGLLRDGKILAVKSLGGYHLACDARNASAVLTLRERKFRKEKPFALLVGRLEVAGTLARLDGQAEELLASQARPIVLAPARVRLAGVAPDTQELGVMLPYTPLHHLLFAEGAPEVLVMTSANRSSEPIAYTEKDAFDRLSGIADAFLVGERPIARRMDDSIARVGSYGTVILRRSRGYAPHALARLPGTRPILAMGADLKNTVTLVAGGQAFGSQHIGDLGDFQSLESYRQAVQDLQEMYEISRKDLLVVCDAHPQYTSSIEARALECAQVRTIQHHRAHIASVLAEREAWEERVIGVTFDGTGYGDDGSIWGGEFFEGSIASGFRRIAHLRYASLPGGDAAARHPIQSAAGYLREVEDLPDLFGAPFAFPERYESARSLLLTGLRIFRTTSAGRLFDAAAALLGFVRPVTFEGQAACWLEQLARQGCSGRIYPFPFSGEELDFRPLLHAVAADRSRGRAPADIALDFHRSVARAICDAVERLTEQFATRTVALSGGVFQNDLLLREIRNLLAPTSLKVWINHNVPPNDGGISLGQAALAAFSQFHDFRDAKQDGVKDDA